MSKTVLLDVLTAFSCVAYWSGIWSLLDIFEVDEVAAGLFTSVLIFFLAVFSAHQILDTSSSKLEPLAKGILTWLWTCCLAVCSICIWRLGFFLIHKHLLKPDKNLHAVLVAMLGAAILLPAGRFRTASSAAPVAIAFDSTATSGEPFPKAVFSGPQCPSVLLDFALTVPVMLAWAGLWMLADNLSISPVWSGLACLAFNTACTWFRLNEHLRDFCSRVHTSLPSVADALWTALLTVVIVGIWRGIWEGLVDHLHIADRAHNAALTAVLGAFGLTALGRHRGTLFPPVEFELDDGDAFVATGCQSPRARSTSEDISDMPAFDLDSEAQNYGSTAA